MMVKGVVIETQPNPLWVALATAAVDSAFAEEGLGRTGLGVQRHE